MAHEDEKLFVDPTASPAALIDQGKTMRCPTLSEAVMAWHRLPEDNKAAATIKVFGKVYTAGEIDRMHYGPKPSR